MVQPGSSPLRPRLLLYRCARPTSLLVPLRRTAVKWIHAREFGGPYPSRPLATNAASLERAERLLAQKQQEVRLATAVQRTQPGLPSGLSPVTTVRRPEQAMRSRQSAPGARV